MLWFRSHALRYEVNGFLETFQHRVEVCKQKVVAKEVHII